MQDTTLNVIPGPMSEADRAADLKRRAAEALAPVLAIMDEAVRQGLMVRWANVGMNSFGMHEVIDLHIEKRFK